MIHYERDLTQSESENRDLFYPLVTGLKENLEQDLSDSESDSMSNSGELDDGSDTEDVEDKIEARNVRDGMSRDEWKVCKKAIKEQQREKRKNKIPKHVKRRKEKAGKRKK